MTDRDLENLKNAPVPAARPHAKRAALDAALSAFSLGASDSADAEPAGCADQNPSQGNITPLRQTETSTQKRNFRMYLSSRATQAMAASVAAIVVAAPFAFQHLETLRHRPPLPQTQTERAPSSPKPNGTSGPAVGPLADAGVAQKVREKPFADDVKKSDSASTSAALPQPEPAPTASSEQSAVSALAAPAIKVDRADGAMNGADPGRRESALSNPSDRLSAAAPSPRSMTLSLEGGKHPTEQTTQAPAPPPPVAARQSAGATIAGIHTPSPLIDSAADVRAQLDGLAKRQLQYMSRDRVAVDAVDAVKPNAQGWIGGTDQQPPIFQDEHRDKFEAKEVNPVKQVASEPVSTFSTDVDTASYAFVRRALSSGRLPPKDAVRVEEMINYFPYAYPAPDTADVPFKPTVTVLPSPWNANNKLVHIAIKGYDIKSTERPRANLVFLIDVSGSMGPADRLPLLKNAFRMLVDQLKPDDTVALVTYASGSGVALEPTKISDKAKILSAIDRLGAGGSTAGAAGIADAYRLAEASFDKSAVNRVVLATDGDFNVGITDQNELKSYIERKRQSGIFLSILGVGQGNHNDALMQTLAQNGNGTAAYVDTLNEARKVLVDEASSTLFTIAKDVKAQIEWNPARISEYRLIGYETRALRREDFNNDAVDAGDIGSGHTVTAIYEVTPAGAPLSSDALRYGKASASEVKPVPDTAATPSSELGFLKLRYKRPNDTASQLISLPLTDDLARPSIADVPAEQRFSIAVAAFAQLLKGETYLNAYTYDDVIALAQTARGDDPFGYRAEFLNIVRLAKNAQP